MKIGIPISEGKLCLHFGHCDKFALVEVDMEKQEIVNTNEIDAPPHQPGLLPVWLAEKGVNLIIAGGMGQRAQNLFIEKGIDVVVGASPNSVDAIIKDYLSDKLETTQNICDH